MIRDAVLTQDQRYRYRLTRTWEDAKGRVCWIMLNPSTADASADDPTIRRCMLFTRREGYGGIIVVNLCAVRSTDPKALLVEPDPIGKDNAEYILGAIHEAKLVIGAWGAVHKKIAPFAEMVADLIRKEGIKVMCLGVTATGQPRHPLYVSGFEPLVEWK